MDNTVRFLLYNIRYAAGAELNFHFPVPYSGYFRRTSDNLALIARFVRSVHADIIGLLEVDGGSFRTGRRSQAEEIAQGLGHYHVYRCKYGCDSLAHSLPLLREQGNALMTNREIQSERCHYFSVGVKRLVLEMELEDVVVVLVHLSLKYRHRQYQLMELRSWLREISKPLIVAGDFNLFRGVRELQPFLEATGLRNGNCAGYASHSSRNPRRQLDFILHSRQIEITHFQVPHIPYSDHLPLYCDFEIRQDLKGASPT
jgi:endonuclease/exonuclease/phosphatase family metal-dependent hydrolase